MSKYENILRLETSVWRKAECIMISCKRLKYVVLARAESGPAHQSRIRADRCGDASFQRPWYHPRRQNGSAASTLISRARKAWHRTRPVHRHRQG